MVSRRFSCHGNRGIDYGEDLAVVTLRLLSAFVADAKALADLIESADDG